MAGRGRDERRPENGLVGRVRQVGLTLASPSAMAHRYENLVAWRRADDLFIRVHNLAAGFPSLERFERGSQLRRAAYSVPANIVEGFTRRSRRERLHFLNIAEASLAEVGYCLHVAKRLGYLGLQEYATYQTEVQKAAAPLVGLIRAVRSETVPPA